MNILKTISLALAALSLAAGVSAAQEKTTLKFLHKWPEPQNMAYFQKAVSAFEAAHPNIEIKMEAVADEPYKDKIRVVMASGDIPDIYFSWSGEFARQFVRGGRALDLTDAVMQSDWKDRLPQAALDPYKLDGRLYGIPINVDAKYMVYNKAIFDKNGLKPPKTWSEFQSVLAKLKEAGVTPIAFGNQYPWASSHYIGDLNAKLVPDDVRRADYDLRSPPDKLFTHPGYVRALDEFLKLQQNGYFNRGANALTHAIARGSFTAGRTAMMYLELVEFGDQLKGTPLDKAGWDFFTMPAFEDGAGDPSILTGAPDGFLISSKSAHPKEAIEFLKFITSVDQARAYSATTGMTSSVVGGVDPATTHPMIIKGLDVLGKAKALALWLDTDIDAQTTAVYLAGMQAILNGTKTPSQVMQDVRNTALKVKKERGL
jgi:raffinose/stachyose/melibiose transport system substrate-binding protein